MFKFNVKNGKDVLNLSKKRNLQNTEMDKYNCGGFALGTYNWYDPFVQIGEPYMPIFKPVDYMEIFYFAKKMICTEFEGLIRNIQNLEEIKNDEYGVAFRIGSDFHFYKQIKGGMWMEKKGKFAPELIPQEKVFSANKKFYNEILLFAKKI